ncbi:MAG TPA: hypothetical protein VMN56_06855 [Casimicrobiaceae bacterium]|nr:hypothetical protein [Casimicrobiaceae bacterium]
MYDRDSTHIDVARGASETWPPRNYYTSAPHPMHRHGIRFRTAAPRHEDGGTMLRVRVG